MSKNIPNKKNTITEKVSNEDVLSDEEVVDDSIFESNKETVNETTKNISGSKQSNFFNSFSKLLKRKKKVGNLGLLETNLIKDEIEINFNWKKDLIIFLVLSFLK